MHRFAEVQLQYGLVGHTHNGNDQGHAIHNKYALCVLMTNLLIIDCSDILIKPAGNLGQVVSYFFDFWRDSSGERPTPVLFDVVYDFDSYYKGRMKPITGNFYFSVTTHLYLSMSVGFTRTASDPYAVGQFKATKGPGGFAQLWWRPPCVFDAAWIGADGAGSVDGYTVLCSSSQTAPKPVSPLQPEDEHAVKALERAVKQKDGRLISHMRLLLEEHALEECYPWLLKLAKSNVVEYETIDSEVPPGRFGRLVQIGSSTCGGRLMLVKDEGWSTAKDFFDFPCAVVKNVVTENLVDEPLPNVRGHRQETFGRYFVFVFHVNLDIIFMFRHGDNVPEPEERRKKPKKKAKVSKNGATSGY